eukprot:6473851-Amphidinium_carterae.1
MASPLRMVEKTHMIRAAQKDAAMLRDETGHTRVNPPPTGHFMRRSGAKDCARRGLPLHRIQWMGRWGSLAVLVYVEEAAEETPGGLSIGQSCQEMDEVIAQRVAQLVRTSVKEDIVQTVKQEVAEAYAATADELNHKVAEVNNLVMPSCVVSISSNTVHAVLSGFVGDPSSCVTRCGWRWGGGSARVVTDTRVSNAKICSKCKPFLHAVAPEWVRTLAVGISEACNLVAGGATGAQTSEHSP